MKSEPSSDLGKEHTTQSGQLAKDRGWGGSHCGGQIRGEYLASSLSETGLL